MEGCCCLDLKRGLLLQLEEGHLGLEYGLGFGLDEVVLVVVLGGLDGHLGWRPF